MTEHVEYDDTYDDEQYDAIQSIAVNQVSLNDNDADQQHQYTTDEAVENDPDSLPENIFGFSATLIRTLDAEAAHSDNDSMPSLAASSVDESDYGDGPPSLAATSVDDSDYVDYGDMPSLAATSVDDSDYGDGPPSLAATSVDDSDDSDYVDHRDMPSRTAISTDEYAHDLPDLIPIAQDEIWKEIEELYGVAAVARYRKKYPSNNTTNTVIKISANAATSTNIHTGPSDIIAYLDSAAGGHIFLPDDRTNMMFTHHRIYQSQRI